MEIEIDKLKKYSSIAASLILIIILYLIFKPDVTKECKNMQDIYEKNKCFTKIAGQGEDIDICEMINDVQEKDLCYQTVAIKKSSMAICDKIRDNLRKESCYRTVKLID
jgi:hypothetical protein